MYQSQPADNEILETPVKKKVLYLLPIAALLLLLNLTYKNGESAMKLTSPAFENNQPIPATFTCEGNDHSPALRWEGEPASTKSFALICSDPDAPHGTFIHWVLYDIPSNVHELPEGIMGGDTLSNGAKQGMSSFNKIGFGGPCPPSGTHHYHFDLFAIDTMLNKPAGLSEEQLRTAMHGHIVAQARLTGLYKKSA